MPNAKRLFSGLSPKVDEDRVSVSIHDFGAPFLGGVNDAHSLSYNVSGKIM